MRNYDWLGDPDRALKALNLERYSIPNYPSNGVRCSLEPPPFEQYVLRMLIQKQYSSLKIPFLLGWIIPMLNEALRQQSSYGIRQPFCYLTVRHGIVHSKTDDEWHVDGFSMNITHLPEQNYIWCSNNPTEYVAKSIHFPQDFNPDMHNVHNFIQTKIGDNDTIHTMESESIYCIDPYVIHRRAPNTQGIHRTFVRISFTPIEIMDVNNTENPFIETNYTRDGIKDFRDNLTAYSPTKLDCDKFSGAIIIDDVHNMNLQEK